MAQVFISYSRRDLSFVERLAGDLQNAGLDVWYDMSSLGGGSRWSREIEAGIKKSQYVIIVLSPDSVASEWVEREFLFASNLRRKIIPLLYRPCELPISYLDLNYIDVQRKNYRENFDELLRALDTDLTKLSSPTQVKPPKLPFVLQTRYMALIGAVAILLVTAGIFSFNGWNRPSSPETPVESQLRATETAEAGSTISILPSVTDADPSSFGIPLTGSTSTPGSQVDPISIQFTPDNQFYPPNGFVLPDSIQPLLSSAENQVSDIMVQAWNTLAYLKWQIVPGIYPASSPAAGEMATEVPVSFQIMATNSNTAWAGVDNTMRLSVSKDSVLESVQLVHMEVPQTTLTISTEELPSPVSTAETEPTGGFIIPVTGGVSWHRASEKINLTSENKTSNFLLVFREADLYTLQPGESEFFQFTVVCKAPGTYHFVLEAPYTYGEKGIIKLSAIPPVVCPVRATYWTWWYGFYSKHEYTWDGAQYRR